MTVHPLLAGRRVLVVGASSGLGAAIAKSVVLLGGDVTVSARRTDRLEELVAEMGAGHAVAGDATSRDDAHAVVDRAAELMGGIDLSVYVAGLGILQRLRETDTDTWQRVFAVNVIGANHAAAAALDHVGRNGIIAFMSSRTTIDANAYFASYSSTKAALDQCIRTWRIEHPDRRFVRIVMGNAQPTEFANNMGFELLGPALEAWGQQRIPGGLMHTDDAAMLVAKKLALALDHPEIDSSEMQLDARIV